jgi:hypothetical protein
MRFSRMWTNSSRVVRASGCKCQSRNSLGLEPWMKEVKGIRHRGRGVYLRCPVFTTVQFSLRNEGSSEYICLCEGREILSPNFQTFQDPRHQIHGIGRLVSETLYLFATLALLHIQADLILGTFLPSLKGPKHDQVGCEFFYIKQPRMVR